MLKSETIDKVSKLLGSKPEYSNELSGVKWQVNKTIEETVTITEIKENHKKKWLVCYSYYSPRLRPIFDGMFNSIVRVEKEEEILHYISMSGFIMFGAKKEMDQLGREHAWQYTSSNAMAYK